MTARDVDRVQLAAKLRDIAAILGPNVAGVLNEAADELAGGFPVSVQWEADIVRIIHEGFTAHRMVGTAENVIGRVRLLISERRKR